MREFYEDVAIAAFGAASVDDCIAPMVMLYGREYRCVKTEYLTNGKVVVDHAHTLITYAEDTVMLVGQRLFENMWESGDYEWIEMPDRNRDSKAVAGESSSL